MALSIADAHPWVTAQPFYGLPPTWMPDEDAARIASYRTYHETYWTNPGALKIKALESEQVIYLPDARTLVNTTNHYLCKGLTASVPDPGGADGLALAAFLKRERFKAKFMVAKRQGVAFGDWVLHLTADPDAPPGRRISLNSVDPGEYFPVWDPDDLDKKQAVHLARQEIVTEGGKDKTLIRRKTYRYVTGLARGATRRVTVEEGMYDPETWFAVGGRATRVILEPTELPPEIQTIPVYHFRNQPWRGDPFGSSELRGFESLLRGESQIVTDSQLALRLEGNGVFVTDAPPPRDPATGDEQDWEVAPGRVIQVAEGRRFDRVPGIQSVGPMLDHVGLLRSSLWEAAGMPDVSRGRADVSVVESGIALAIQFSPMDAKIEDREAEALGNLDNFWFDWATGWLPAFEQTTFASEVTTALGDKLPLNQDTFLARMHQLLDDRLVSREWVRGQLRSRLGLDIPEGMEGDVLAESQSMAAAFDLPGSTRVDTEALGGGGQDGSSQGPNQ